ncbi:MAG: hypothetical protein CBD16_07405 [Betaproteobacteria bacterium TMED156]|nr:MAG: hypothetical protein CBD16_07405 [Betaproteobacteria bacterium TMED156]
MTVTVYVYDDTHTVIVNTSANQGSTTMYDKTIKLYQGIDNTVKFALKDNDRNAVDLTNLTVTFNIFDATTNESILARPLTVTNATKGLAQLNLPASAIDNVAGTFYNYSLYTTNASSEQQVVFTDLNEAAKGTLEVVEGIASNPRETEQITFESSNPNFTKQNLGKSATGETWYYSSAVSGASERNLTSATHTIALYSDGFDGDFIVEGSMESTANTTSHTEWFHIKLDGESNDYVSLTNATTIASYNFTSMAKWIRVIYLPTAPADIGKITKVLVRN